MVFCSFCYQWPKSYGLPMTCAVSSLVRKDATCVRWWTNMTSTSLFLQLRREATSSVWWVFVRTLTRRVLRWLNEWSNWRMTNSWRTTNSRRFIHSFILEISIAPLQVYYNSDWCHCCNPGYFLRFYQMYWRLYYGNCCSSIFFMLCGVLKFLF